MANNLHVSYDLITPGQNYDKVIERIKQLGSWAKPHMSFWYVNSTYTASQAVDYIKPALDVNDKVYVVDATNNTAAWNSLPENVATHIKEQWTR
ncbi:MAG: hypothetical protein KKE77_03460 [Alphaproteobacteria bacterium]|nr:hypothetical protein [Alphaproteobacteria bacterium]